MPRITVLIGLVDTGSEDTFREMLRIKRAVQASFNTEGSFIAAQAAAAQKGIERPTDTANAMARDAADPMAAMERELVGGRTRGPAFVASTLKNPNASTDGAAVEVGGGAANPDAIAMDEDGF